MSRNPLANILVACAGIAVVALVRWPLGPALGLAGFAVAAHGTGVARRTIRSGVIVVGVVVILGLILRGLQGNLTWEHGFALLTTATTVGVVAAMAILVVRVTDRRDLGLDLERRGAPRSLAFAVVGLAGAPGALGRRWRRIVEAQLARGVRLDRSLLDRVRALPVVVVPLVVASLHDLADRTLARESRGISQPGRRTLLDVPPETTVDRVLAVGSVVLIGLLIVANLAGIR